MKNARALFCVLAGALAMPATAGDSLETYGVGTRGTNGKTPAIWATAVPRIGAANFGLSIEKGRPSSAAVVALAAGRANLTIGGLTLLVDLQSAFFPGGAALDANGNGTFPLPLPNAKELIGLSFHCQAFPIDPGATAFGISGTDGLTVKISRPGLLIAPSQAGGNSPVWGIQLASGQRVNFSGGRVASSPGAVFTADGTHVIVADQLARKLHLYDATVFPPKWVKTATTTITGGFIQAIGLHPDGKRLYVVPNASRTATAAIEVWWAIPALFGTKYPGPDVALGKYKDCVNIVFAPNGRRAYLSALGLLSGGAQVVAVDTDGQSSKYHQIVGTVAFPGRYCTHVDITKDGVHLFASMWPLAGNSELAMIIAPALLARDFDPNRPGQQNLGGERPRTPIANNLNAIRVGPRGHFVYMAHGGGTLAKIDVRLNESTFKRIVSRSLGRTPATLGLAIDDAGALVYVTTGSVLEHRASDLSPLRRWTGSRNMYTAIVR